ncbi:nuclear transport factor 2 family protein [Aeromonas caviae]|uniref:nuclear transport factor 2 family protein n=1 Tax=Aeromonas caviae TaxID=648 RepID=UPI00143303DD|nr:nuclear transport factor 2 family protein [Aeromonas caviae]MBL0543107.1 nuclear transport factor 2 family protein [Aeromonas caviae]NKD18200.1 nuclear transport factor 2 family protein [Aeromonas caviae]
MHHTERLKACLQRVICDPAFPLAELDDWFTPDYCQEVNGERLDYPAFHQHIATLRRHLAGASIEFVATLAQGERVHSTHVVRATRQDGGNLVCKVSGLFTFRGDRICHTDEVTCLLAGSKEDADIGSRC